jgi:hypothetical protein
MGFNIIGIDLNRLLIFGHRFFEFSPPLVGDAKIEMGLGEIGVSADGFFVLRNLLFPFLLPSVDNAEVEMGFCIL